MIQAHPSLFMRQVHNYQKVGKAGVVITGEGQSSCWTCRGPRGLLLQKKKTAPQKIIRLGRLSKSQSCKTGSVYAAHPHKLASPSRYPPPGTAGFTHALWQEDQTTKWMEAWGARKSSLWWRRYGEGRSFHSTPQQKTKWSLEAWPSGGGDDDKKLSFCSLHRAVLETRHTSHASCRVDGFASHWPICMLMKRNWSPLNSFCFKM